MTLTEQLKQFREATLTRMPQSIIQTFQDGIQQIKEDQLKENALQKGDSIPNFSLYNIGGQVTPLIDVHQSDFLVLNFYRGGWCPYCNMELREYERLKNDFKKARANIVAISAEIPQLATQTSQKNKLSFPVLTDINAQFMKQIGLVFQLNEKTKSDYASFGMDFQKIHGNEHYELPVPAIYVIDKNFKIVFVHFEADYMTRIEPKQVLTILNKEFNH